ncbi:MAG: CPBP family intramembrane metalloprotease [Acidobacteria bacterium]|nr:MAG: CPBP family intramembrane metalloprotease [Acidobacteriota bacterium]
MSDLQINEEEPRLVVGLGGEPQKGPKLSMKAFLFGVVVLLFGGLCSVISKSWADGVLFLYVGYTALCFVLQHEYRPRLRQFGLSRGVLWSRRTLAWIGPGLALAGAELIFLYGTAYLVSALGPSRHTLMVGVQPLGRIIQHPFEPLIIGVIGPILEELLFRGYLYLVLRQNWGRRWAALVSSAIYAACHLGNVLFMAKVFVVSVLDIYLNNKARSLAPSIAEHASYNLILSVVTFHTT